MFKINWKIKVYIYKILVFLKANKILYFIQKKITKRSRINISEIYHYWEYHLKNINLFHSINILEFGAGKSLEQNIYLSYQLEDKINQTLIDIDNMIDVDLFNQASDQISKVLKKTKKNKIYTINDIQNNFKIRYLAPHTIKELKNYTTKFDACISSNTLEHLPLNELQNIISDLKYVMKSDSVLSFAIDYSDHFSHTDNKISSLNFLKYERKEWEKYNTKFLYQNRLRHQDYKKIFIENGYKIVEEKLGTIAPMNEIISNEFNSSEKETFALWGLFTLKIK